MWARLAHNPLLQMGAAALPRRTRRVPQHHAAVCFLLETVHTRAEGSNVRRLTVLVWPHTSGRRHGGADHVFFTTQERPSLHPSPLATCDLHAPLHTSLTRHAQDFGKCYLSPRVAHRAIIVSHFGFRGGLADFMSLKRWRGVSHGALNASASLSVHDPKIQRRLNRSVTDNSRPPPPRAVEPGFELWNGGGAAQRNYSVARDLRRTAYIPWRAHLSYLASTWLWARDRWVGSCFDPQKDIVTPVRAGRWASLEPTY